ncbi:MAG: DegT/DnrJ/EryC1/StrS family aminotransferase, partial [Chitinophagaceae bacterium]
DGGALMTNNEALGDNIQMIANHGQSKRYYHDLVGCNSRLDSLQAAVLNIKLKYLDEYIAARQRAAAYYSEAFKNIEGLQTPFIAPYSSHVFHQYTLLVKNDKRNALHDHLAQKGIPSMIYYPVPAHQQKMFEGVSDIPSHLTVTDSIKDEVLSLPMHTELDEEQLKFITKAILDFFY